IIARHFSDAVEIAFHLLPTAGGFVGADLHRLSENRILGKNESRFDLVFGFLQFTIADQLGFYFLHQAVELALEIRRLNAGKKLRGDRKTNRLDALPASTGL